ncbi:MAG: 16S rRNA (cytosine(967)-C(5))-methyltransferase RsmB [Ruminococcus sp.]|nr:16S rRNA (cytosine(967)-C(5))-methyltransferase RsmB [Ruminococcus sp.]
MMSARSFAVRLLTRMDKDSSYSNLLLDEALSRSQLSEQDKAFAAALFYGTLERSYTLDRIISSRLKNPQDRLSEEVRNILRTGLYQLLYMDSVPDSAAVDESVKLAKKTKNPAAAGFVNALLRGFIRDGKALPKTNDETETLSLEYSCPPELTAKWLREYGREVTETMLSASLGQAPVTARANTLKAPLPDIIAQLQKDGFGVSAVAGIDDCLKICGQGIERSQAYKQGLIHVQDISCQLCCLALGAQPGDTVLDICSAPGGKAFTAAEMMKNNGSLLAFDLHENRARLIRKGAERLGLDCITAGVNNGKEFNPEMPMADRVLCDVPCSGLGVIRRKPEIKYKPLSDFDRLPEVQYDILATSSRYVKEGGVLVYSTCTLSKAENEGVTGRFLSEHPEFDRGALPEILGGGFETTITSDRFDSDGFYIAVMRRMR